MIRIRWGYIRVHVTVVHKSGMVYVPDAGGGGGGGGGVEFYGTCMDISFQSLSTVTFSYTTEIIISQI